VGRDDDPVPPDGRSPHLAADGRRRESRMSDTITLDKPADDWVSSSRPNRTFFVLLALAALAGVFLPGLVTSVLLLSLMTQAVIGAITATGVGLLCRQNGVVSFGHAAFYGAAAYIIGLSLRCGLLPAELAIVMALVVPPLLAFL